MVGPTWLCSNVALCMQQRIRSGFANEHDVGRSCRKRRQPSGTESHPGVLLGGKECHPSHQGASCELRSVRLLGPPVVPFYPFLGEGSPTKIDYRKKGYPYVNLSTKGPSLCTNLLDDVNPQFPAGAARLPEAGVGVRAGTRRPCGAFGSESGTHSHLPTRPVRVACRKGREV